MEEAGAEIDKALDAPDLDGGLGVGRAWGLASLRRRVACFAPGFSPVQPLSPPLDLHSLHGPEDDGRQLGHHLHQKVPGAHQGQTFLRLNVVKLPLQSLGEVIHPRY